MEAYSAVHNEEAKEEFYAKRDELSEMDFSLISDEELLDIAEEVLEELFAEGYSIDTIDGLFEEVISEAKVSYGHDTASPRKEKVDRMKGALKGAVGKVKEKARSAGAAGFAQYRKAKGQLQNKATQAASAAGKMARQKTAEVQKAASTAKSKAKRGLKGLVGRTASRVAQGATKLAQRMSEEKAKKDDSYLETDMKKRQANNEKARKELAKGPQMKNPHFEAYMSIYEKKKMDPVGEEDGDIDNDGDEDSSDKYLAKRRKAIGKAMGKKMKKEEVEYVDEDSRRMSNKQHTRRVRSNIQSFGSNYTPPDNFDPGANRGQGEVLTRKQIEKKRRKALRQEEVQHVEEGRSSRPRYPGGRGVLDTERRQDKRDAAAENLKGHTFGPATTTKNPKKLRKQKAMGELGEGVTFSEAELERIQQIVDSWES